MGTKTGLVREASTSASSHETEKDILDDSDDVETPADVDDPVDSLLGNLTDAIEIERASRSGSLSE